MRKSLPIIIGALFLTSGAGAALHYYNAQPSPSTTMQQQTYFNQGSYQTQTQANTNYKSEQDRTLLKKINIALENNGIDPRNVTLFVANRKVIIDGKTGSNEEADSIIEVVRNVDGVDLIENRLTRFYAQSDRGQSTSPETQMHPTWRERLYRTFKPSEERQAQFRQPETLRKETNPTQDRQLAQRIQDAIQNSRFANAFENVDITVSNGTVTITGTIPSERNRRDLQEIVHQFSGIARVNDQLEVESN